MRIVILAIGSQGDIQPYVALGLGLKHAGHDVALGTHRTFEALVRGRGLHYEPVEGDPQAIAENHTREWGNEGGLAGIRRSWRAFMSVLTPLFHQITLDCLRACEDADVIVVNGLALFVGYPIGEKLGVPVVRAFYAPNTPTRTFPAGIVPNGVRLNGPLNLLTHHVVDQLVWLPLRPLVRAAQGALGLPPSLPIRPPFHRLDRRRELLLYGYSPTVIPRPRDWPAWIEVTGYWFLDSPADWQPPDELVRFLQAGPPPVYVGFGSTPERDAPAITALIVAALARAGQRGVLVRGWGGVDQAQLSDQLLEVDSLPFDWLFPRMAAVVHHGGAGTTAIGLRAGIPAVIAPAVMDQPLWANRVQQLGVGLSIPRRILSVDGLAAAIRTATSDPEMRRRAAALGERIRAEDGVARAVQTLEHRFASDLAMSTEISRRASP